MKSMKLAVWLTAAAILLPLPSREACATALYIWHPVNSDVPYPVPDEGRFEVTTAAYRAGYMNYTFERGDASIGDPAYLTDPDSPILALEFGWLPLQPRVTDGTFDGSIEAHVGFGTYLSGRLWINYFDHTYRTDSLPGTSPPLWDVSYITDASTACHDAFCSGGTGYWTLDSVTVAEPNLFPAFGLLAFGLLGAQAAQRWRRTHHRDERSSRASEHGAGEPAERDAARSPPRACANGPRRGLHPARDTGTVRASTEVRRHRIPTP